MKCDADSLAFFFLIHLRTKKKILQVLVAACDTSNSMITVTTTDPQDY